MKKIRVWDLPLRLFHWSLALMVLGALITEGLGGKAMVWHFRFGYATLALVSFRVFWGLLGPRYARFSNFVFRPSTIIAYARDLKNGLKHRATEHHLGHNPLAGLSVLAMLGVLLIQTISGLFSHDDDNLHEGPLVNFISQAWSDRLSNLHADISGTLIYFLIGLHLLAIAYYYWEKQNLVTPMITGDKEVDFDAPAANDSWATRLLALALIVACGFGVVKLATV